MFRHLSQWILPALCLSLAAAAPAQTPKRPNIVLILGDDLRHDAFGATGHPFSQTPNIDRIAQEGAQFQNSFVTHSLCSPSRASILTGLYSHQHRVLDNNTPLRTSAITFPIILHAAGYETAYIGKWHMSQSDAQPRQGFDRWVSFAGQGEYLDPSLNIDGQELQATGHLTDILTDYALEFLQRDRRAPFLLILSHKAVHGPLIPQAKFDGLYANAKVNFPATWNEDLSAKPSFLQDHLFTGNLPAFTRKYYECLAGLDESVGKVLAALAQKNILDNTMVIFTSDNGYFLGEHHLIDKRLAYEESMRVPLFVRYPAWFAAGSKIESMALNLDLAPTITEAAEITKTYNFQGLSLRKLARQEARREAFIFQYYVLNSQPQTPAIRALRTPNHKYITYLNSRENAELYDLRQNPLETENQINNVSYQSIGARLRFQLDSLRSAIGDTAGITTVDSPPGDMVTDFVLYQNYPNPFNPTTAISYSLRGAGRVRLEIFDVAGRRVETLVDQFETAGLKIRHWDAAPYANGIYWCKLTVGAFSRSHKMIIAK